MNNLKLINDNRLKNEIPSMLPEGKLALIFFNIKAILSLPDKNKPHVVWQLIKSYLHALSTKYPTSVHESIVKKYFKESEKPDNPKLEQSLTEKLTRHCKKLGIFIEPPSEISDLFLNLNIANNNFASENSSTSICTFLENEIKEHEFIKNDLFIWDLYYLKYLETLSEREDVKQCIEAFRKLCEKSISEYKKTNNINLNHWFETGDNFGISPALLELTHIILKTEIQSKKLSSPQSHIIKSSINIEAIKMGRKDHENQLSNFRSGARVIGLDFEKKHFHAVNAVQKMLNSTEYKGNAKGVELDGNNDFKFTGYLPRLGFTKDEYLENCGLKKYETSRGRWEYRGGDVEEAMSALFELSTKNHLIIHDIGTKRIQTFSPIWRLYEGWNKLTEKEAQELDNNIRTDATKAKHTGFLLEPCPLLVNEIDKRFQLKPANMYEEIKLKFPKASKFVYKFVDLILLQATFFKGNRESKQWPSYLEFSRETLAYKLRLNTYILSRNWKRIDKIINDCIQKAKNLGWITNHEITTGKTVDQIYIFYLNKPKFTKIHESKPVSSS